MSDERTVPRRGDRDGASDRIPSRRALLATIGTAAVGGMAGCGGDDATPTGETSTAAPATAAATDTATATETATDMATDTATETATQEPTSTPIEEGGPPGDEGWQLTFEDRFEGGELDRSRWGYRGGMGVECAGGSLECFDRENVWVDPESDRLVIETADQPAADRDYASGAINTRDAFTQEFGYFEAKSRPPAVPGGLPAFWIWWNPDDWGHRREIDFYEITGAQPNEPIHNVHVDCERRTPGEGSPEWTGGRSTISPGADEAFHVWGCEWTPDSVAFYVDGEEKLRREDDIIGNCLAGEQLWIVLSTHVHDDMGDPTEASYPYTHEFEWVRAWQREEWA